MTFENLRNLKSSKNSIYTLPGKVTSQWCESSGKPSCFWRREDYGDELRAGAEVRNQRGVEPLLDERSEGASSAGELWRAGRQETLLLAKEQALQQNLHHWGNKRISGLHASIFLYTEYRINSWKVSRVPTVWETCQASLWNTQASAKRKN